MCRLLVYVGPQNPILMSNLLILPPRSIIHQSYACELREKSPSSALNGDGFGVGWYANSSISPCIFTSISPAWNNRNLHRLSSQITSPLFFAHIRAASPGSPTNESNCHPFQFEQFMWMHNGMIADFHLIKKNIIHFLSDDIFNLIQGTTDSEYAFVLFLQVLFTKLGLKFQPTDNKIIPSSNIQIQNCEPMILKDAMDKTIRLLNQWIRESGTKNSSMMNFCVTDGSTVVSSRYTNFHDGTIASLFFSSGTNFQRNPAKPESFMMAQSDRRQRCHIIASEPLTADTDDWVEVPRNHIVVVTPLSNLLLFPIDDIIIK
mmetsp:Transcript_129705/g.193069  ORF Transcript_129705/g.193069 Transcript_129705/m.193069 type:complete len:318 (+) Transcript_129705:37-990(+)